MFDDQSSKEGHSMDHRKFAQRLNELMTELTHSQAQKVIEALRQRGDSGEVQHLIEQRLDENRKCPRCGSAHIEGWGREKNGLKRYRCCNCQRTFNPLTGTSLARLRQKERWLNFAEALNGSLSVRKAAKACKVNKNTAFKWRHRFLKAQNQSKDQSLAGIAEVDEIFLLESFKGQRKLPRAARKRGGVAEKPGLSAEQIPILIARDRTGAHIDAVLANRTEAAVRPVLAGKLSKTDTLLCMDGDKALIAFAEAEGMEYELIIASKGEHVHEKVLHIQNVNAYGRRFKQWLDQFNGVATKYLPNYLGWRRWLEKGEDAITPQTTLAAAFC
jgi:transposase-like protein